MKRDFICTFAPMDLTRAILVSTCLFCLAIRTEAQNTQPGYINPEERPVKMDTPSFEPIQYVELNNIYVYPAPFFKDEAQEARYNRLVYNVKKVLPIAKEVSSIVIETGDYLNSLPNEEARKKHMKYVEKSIIKEYTPRMKKLTYQQGKLLIKLVYRECGSSSYNLIQAFFGPTRAGLYQGVAWFFGASLMKQYEPNGIDRLTERVVRQVESGQI